MRAQESAIPPVFKSPEGEQRYLAAYDAVIRDWPVACEELDLATGLGRTHVIASGPRDAPVVVLLPSMAGSATLWRPNVAALSARYRACAVDVIGQVGKSVPATRMRSRGQFAAWLCDVVDGLGAARASIVGSSYGGFLALNQAILSPERVDKVVLISPAGTFAGGLVWVFVRGALKRLFSRHRQRDVTDLLGKGAVIGPADRAWRDLMTVTLSVSARPSLAPPVVFSAAELESVRAPTLLLIGENEILYDAHATLRSARRRMPGLQGAVIPGAHHLAALACPEDVNGRILEFLERG